MIFLLNFFNALGRLLWGFKNGFHIWSFIRYRIFNWISHGKTEYRFNDASLHSRLFGLLFVEYVDSYTMDLPWEEFGQEAPIHKWGIRSFLEAPIPEFPPSGTIYKYRIYASISEAKIGKFADIEKVKRMIMVVIPLWLAKQAVPWLNARPWVGGWQYGEVSRSGETYRRFDKPLAIPVSYSKN